MFEQLKSWLRKGKKQARRPRPRTILSVEELEERWCPAVDTYTWNPPANAANLNASNSANWEKNGIQQNANGTIPGNNISDVAQLNGVVSNSNITWDQNFTISKLYLMGQYQGVETIVANNTTLDLTGVNGDGSLSADGFQPGLLIVKFADNTGVFEIDNNASIGAFSFNPPAVGGAPGTFLINGGTTTIDTGIFWNKNSVFDGTLKVSNNNEGANATTLEDKGQTQLILVGNKTTIQIEPFGTLQVDGGSGKTLISEAVPGSNDYIDVNGGELAYQGKAGVTDTFTVPVLVEGGGTFSLNGGGGGTLAINGKEQGTNNVSLYSSGYIYLSNGINLNLGSGMNATSISHVASLDSQTETITVASGNPCIVDGSLQIDAASGTYGQFVFSCDTLDFGGTLEVALSGPNNGVCDQLIVNGTLDLDPNSSILDESLDGNATYPESWTIINASGGILNNFSYINPIYGIYYMGYNYPSNGEFTLYYGY